MSAAASARLPRPSWVGLSARAELTVAQRRVLELIESAHHPMTAAEVASALGLHHNTVREHLDALIEAGFVEVSTNPTGRRGRPALHYASAPDPAEVLDSYLTLLDAISETLGTSPQAQKLALDIGRRWAQLMSSAQRIEEPAEGASPAERATSLLPGLSLMGFAPVAQGETLVLKSCPLITGSRVPRPLVCLMHEGYLNEVYERAGLHRSPANDVGARTRLRLTPLLGDGCHITVES